MRSRILIIGVAALLLGARAASANSSGIAGQSCGGCHLSTALPTTSLCIEGLPQDGTYDSNQSYPIRVLVKGIVLQEDGLNLAGFSLRVSNGELSPIDTTTQLFGEDTVATHTVAGNDQTEWDLEWLPDPAAASTTFTLAGNAVNGNGAADSGDFWNVASFEFTASDAPAGAPGKACTTPELPVPLYVPLPVH